MILTDHRGTGRVYSGASGCCRPQKIGATYCVEVQEWDGEGFFTFLVIAGWRPTVKWADRACDKVFDRVEQMPRVLCAGSRS